MQHLYISYPDSEYDLAHRLVDDLQAEGYVVFVDAVSEPGGMAWAAETRHAIRTSGAVIIIFDPARRRPVGIRHESVLSMRRQKPIFVLTRSAGDLPRYLVGAQVLDFTVPYETAIAELRAALPSAAEMMAAPNPGMARSPRRPPRQLNRERRRRRITWGLAALSALVLCIAAGVAFGVIPV
jgi:hypothetical protein